MEAFLAKILELDFTSIIVSLGILLICMLVKGIKLITYKRRINSMLPDEIKNKEDVSKEVSDSVKELEELSFVLAKYGYRLSFNIEVVRCDSLTNESESM